MTFILAANLLAWAILIIAHLLGMISFVEWGVGFLMIEFLTRVAASEW